MPDPNVVNDDPWFQDNPFPDGGTPAQQAAWTAEAEKHNAPPTVDNSGSTVVDDDPWFRDNPFPDGGTQEQQAAWTAEAQKHNAYQAPGTSVAAQHPEWAYNYQAPNSTGGSPLSGATQGSSWTGSGALFGTPNPIIESSAWTGQKDASGKPLDMTGNYIWQPIQGAGVPAGTGRMVLKSTLQGPANGQWQDSVVYPWKTGTASTGAGATWNAASTPGAPGAFTPPGTTTGQPAGLPAGTPTGTLGNNPTYWQTIGDNFGSLIAPWNTPFSFEAPPNVPAFKAPTMEQAQNEPGFMFSMKQGQQALERSAASRGTLLTGGTAKALTAYGQDMGAQNYQSVYNRQAGEWKTNYDKAMGEYTTKYNKAAQEYDKAFNIFTGGQNRTYNTLAGIAGMGQTSAGQLGSAGLGYSGQVGNTLGNLGQSLGNYWTQGANAAAAGTVGAANAWQQFYGNLAQNASSGYANR